MRISGEGPIPSRLMIVGEAPSESDVRAGHPFGGSAGPELNRLLAEAGLMRSEAYCTYVSKLPAPEGKLSNLLASKKKDITPKHLPLKGQYVLPQVATGYTELLEEIAMVQPNVIIALGNLALFALTGNWSVAKWRGSLLRMDPCFKDQMELERPKVIPTYHPGQIFKQFELRGIVLNDLRRVKKHLTSRAYQPPKWNFILRPSFQQAVSTIQALHSDCDHLADPVWLDFDIETRYEHIDCIGFSWSRTDAICIPLVGRGKPDGYWSFEEEAEIVYLLSRLLTHPKVRIRWQNGLYDAQFVYRHWHFIPRGGQDTMISQHSLFSALPKGLAFLASMYAEWYVYWKDEGKIASDVPAEQRWAYNLQDCIYTREVGEVLTQSLTDMGLAAVDAKQQSLFMPVLTAMLRGVRVDPEAKNQMAQAVQEELSSRQAFLFDLLGHEVNPASSKQMQTLFYDDLQQPPVFVRKMVDGRPKMVASCDDEALSKIALKEPLLKPICNAIADIRTLNKFFGDFINMPLDHDGRMRCSFNIAGDAGGKSAPYSYRLSSSKNPFGSGGNLQTIPSEKSKSSGKAAARGSMDFTLPNIRSMYVPDPGFTFFDMDLDRADLQVVVWESDDPMLKAALRMGADIHLLNTYGIDNKEPPPLEELVETHPKYPDHRGPRKHKREFAKVFCHATNYLGKAKTVAAHTGRTVAEIESAQKRWFAAHPGILAWHERVTRQVTRHRFVENKFGYRWYIFDRIDEQLLPAAVAWIPQSTVGIVINRAWLNFYEQLPEVQVLLQVHDSLAGQYPAHRGEYLLPKMREASRIVIPYDDPLIIPTGIKTSTVSWGDCK